MNLRAVLIADGAIRPNTPKDYGARLGITVLKLDERGRRRAIEHIEQGARGALVMSIPSGLAPWHEEAMKRREAKGTRQ